MKKWSICILIVLLVLSWLVLPVAAVMNPVTATVSSSPVAQGEKLFINGTAAGQPSSVAIWILGKTFAVKQTEPVNSDGSFSYELMQDTTLSMYSDQYFVVVQHPMTNGVYDIDWAGAPAEFVYDYHGTTPVSLFRIYGPGSLQGSDAADAIVQGINQSFIDDTYTRLQFQIVNSTTPSRIGIYQNGAWYLDNDGSGTWNTGDQANMFGAPGWTSVVGDWNGDGTTKIGVYKDGTWYLDYNGNGVWNTGIDKVYSFGAPGWTPIVGDWNNTGYSYIGVTNGQQWYLDWNGNGAFDGADKTYSFGAPGWTPVVGKWPPSPILPKIQMIGNVYGLASNPSAGINEIRFTIGLAPGAPAMDLTNMIIVFSTPSTSPIILIQGATASTSVFTTNLSGINPVSTINPSDQIEIVFKVTPVPVNTKVNIEIRPTIGASTAFSKATPPTISSVNVLY